MSEAQDWLRGVRARKGILLALAITACGPTAASVREAPGVTLADGSPGLADGRVRWAVAAGAPPGDPTSSCRLTTRWRGGGREGQIGPLAPTTSTADGAWWTLDFEVGDADLVRLESEASCGETRGTSAARYVATDGARARYCALCADRTVSEPVPAREWGRAGLTLSARVGVIARVEEARVVDDCSGRVLVDLSDVSSAHVQGSPHPESQLERLFEADEGRAVCDDVVDGRIQVEVSAGEVDAIAARLRTVPELAVELSLDPPPG
jgi:hypothetical protein